MTKSIGISGLGLVASGKRNIASGYEYDSLYTRQQLVGTNPIIGGELSDTYDTLNHMADIVLDTLIDTKKVASKLVGNSLEETLRNDWQHVYRHFQYKKDATGIEQIRRPSRSWIDRREGIDCDCMSVVLSSLLHHQKIEHTFRKAAYNEETGWQHVYVIVPKKGTSINSLAASKKVSRDKYYVLDCVVDGFDYEVPFIKKFDKVMKIQYLNGLDFATLSGGVTTQAAESYNEFQASSLLSGFGCEFNGLNGLAGTPNEFESVFLHGLKQHLINTRKLVSINPTLTSGLYEPTAFVERLDALIASFDNAAHRNKILGELTLLEEREEVIGLSGTSLGAGFFKKVGAGIKKAAQKTGEALKKVAKVIVRFNPATIAIRAGVLLAMKLNLFRMAEKLGYGYWTEEQAKEKGLDVSEWRKNKETLEKVRKIHKGLGGKIEKFDKAVKDGWSKGVKKHNLVNGIPGSSSTKSTKATARQQQQKARVVNRVNSAMPLLQQVHAELKPVQYNSLLRKNDSNELDSLFQAVRKNENGVATKLSLAYKPASEAEQYNKGEYKKLLDRTRVVEQMVIKKGGNASQLRDAVNAGKQVAINKANLGEAATVTTAAASGVLAAIGVLLKKINFSTLFKGKASSPNADESEIKKVSVSAPLDDDIDDEGEENATLTPLTKLLDSGTTNSTSFVTSSLQTITNSNPNVSTLASAIKSNPVAAGIAAQALASKSPEVANAIAKSNPMAAKILSAIKSNPVAATIATQLIARTNPSLSQKVSNAINKAIPTAQQVASNLVVQSGNGQEVNVPVQDAEVISSEITRQDNTKQLVKYAAIAAGTLTGLYLLSKAFQASQTTKAIPVANAFPNKELSGTKTRSSQRTRKRVMAITI